MEKYRDYVGDRKGGFEWMMRIIRDLVDEYAEVPDTVVDDWQSLKEGEDDSGSDW